MAIPKFEQYDGPNTTTFSNSRGQYWFSYDTLVAFRPAGGRLVVHENDWSHTTGRHLNVIDGGTHSLRVDAKTFFLLLDELRMR